MTTYQDQPASTEPVASAYAMFFPDGRPAPSIQSVAQTAELFGISTDRVYKAIDNDELYCKKFTVRRFKIMLTDAVKWFNSDRTGEK